MSVSQWDIWPGTINVLIGLETIDPIEGSGCFYFEKEPVGANRHGAIRRKVTENGYQRSGALQAVFEPKLNAAAGDAALYYGIVFLLDADTDISKGAPAGVSDFYMAGYYTQENGGLGGFGIWRFQNNLYDTPSALSVVPDATVATDTPFTLDIEWRQDPGSILGVQMIMSIGTWNPATPFHDLTEIIDVTQLAASGAIMGDSFGEGIAFRNTGGDPIKFLADVISGDSAST